MWIDVICINRDDLDERSSQVAQMERIYRLAKTVVLFLGETWPGRDSAMASMAEDRALHLDPAFKLHMTSHGMHASSEYLQFQIVAFFHSPWWDRLWTVQEYRLAVNIVLQYGDRVMDGGTL